MKKKKESAASRIVEGLKETASERGEKKDGKVRRLPRDFRPPHGASVHYLRTDMRIDGKTKDYETR